MLARRDAIGYGNNSVKSDGFAIIARLSEIGCSRNPQTGGTNFRHRNPIKTLPHFPTKPISRMLDALRAVTIVSEIGVVPRSIPTLTPSINRIVIAKSDVPLKYRRSIHVSQSPRFIAIHPHRLVVPTVAEIWPVPAPFVFHVTPHSRNPTGAATKYVINRHRLSIPPGRRINRSNNTPNQCESLLW